LFLIQFYDWEKVQVRQMNEKINILNIELYQTSAKAAMQKVVQYGE